jgi:hypothetical protein
MRQSLKEAHAFGDYVELEHDMTLLPEVSLSRAETESQTRHQADTSESARDLDGVFFKPGEHSTISRHRRFFNQVSSFTYSSVPVDLSSN